MNNIETHLPDNINIEDFFLKQKKEALPPFSKRNGEMSYTKRYKNVKKIFLKIHNSVEKIAMTATLEKYIEDKSNSDEKEFWEGLELALIYLNNHGKGHVDKIMEKISEMLRHFPQDKGLTAYEMFILLCATQIHDTGNTFGREKHEQVIGNIFDTECKNIIPDKFERTLITKIAMVHGGQIFGSKDTIKNLSDNSNFNNYNIRERLLAALLRFGDELADDKTRADRYGIETDKIPKHSKIFHYYSQSLHTVMIVQNNQNGELGLVLEYNFDSDIAQKKFFRERIEKYLIEEIYDRTIKMEKERRYCMRFLRPYFYLSNINVNIKITDVKYAMKAKDIKYVLEEEGYPDDIIPIKDRISGDEIVKYFKSMIMEKKNE
jgi:hypothetical protein